MAHYTLTIEAPLRPVSTTLHAKDDAEAMQTVTDMLTRLTVGGLDRFRTRLRRPDGSDVYRPTSIAVLLSGLVMHSLSGDLSAR